jgi:hypothetical protein
LNLIAIKSGVGEEFGKCAIKSRKRCARGSERKIADLFNFLEERVLSGDAHQYSGVRIYSPGVRAYSFGWRVN